MMQKGGEEAALFFLSEVCTQKLRSIARRRRTPPLDRGSACTFFGGEAQVCDVFAKEALLRFQDLAHAMSRRSANSLAALALVGC